MTINTGTGFHYDKETGQWYQLVKLADGAIQIDNVSVGDVGIADGQNKLKINPDGTIIARIEDPYNLRGKAADKPPANSVPIGATYWSVDTDPHMYALEASDGEKWFKIVPEDEKTIEIPTDYFFRFDAHSLDLADNASVPLWQDLSGNGNDLSQANAAEQPTYLAAGLNGKPTVQFNGNSISKSSFTLPNDNRVTFFIVLQNEGSSSSVVFSIGNEGSSSSAISFRSSGSSQAFGTYLNTADAVANAAQSTDLSGTMYSSSYNGTVITMYQDGVFVTNTAYTDPIGAHNLLRLGKDPNGNRPFTGKISEIILYSRVLSASEISRMNSYLMEKWGI